MIGDNRSESRSLMPALLATVGAILLWTWGDDLKAQLPALQQQLKQALTLVERGSSQDLDQARALANAARAERRALEQRLTSSDNEQTLRAQVLYDLRLRCAEARVAACGVRLSDAGANANAVPAGKSDSKDAKVDLEALGVRKARAIVSGTFQNDELMTLYQALRQDPSAVWRVNGVLVRNNTFELDVERHIRPQP